MASASNGETPASASTGVRSEPAGAAGGEDVVRRCEMCEKVKEIDSRCLDCGSNMCQDCAGHHKKMKISSDHDIIDYQRWTNPVPSPPLSKIYCSLHKKERLQFYCKVCNKPLCINCKLTKHEGHKTNDLMDEIRSQRSSLPMKLSQIRASFLPILKQHLKEVEDYEKEFSFNVRGTASSIEKRNKTLKDQVDKTRSTLVGKLKQKEQKENHRISERKQALSSFVKTATLALTSGERIIRSGDDFEVIELYARLTRMFKELDEYTTRRPGKSRLFFQEGTLGRAGVDPMFGSYNETTPRVAQPPSPPVAKRRPRPRPSAHLQIVPEIFPQKVSDFQCQFTPGNRVSAIAPAGDGDAWICFGWTTNEIYLYNKSGSRKQRVLLKWPVDDLAVDDRGNVVVTTFAGNSIRLVDRQGNEKLDFITTPLKTRGITVTTAGEILVSGVDRCTAHPVPSKNTIFKYSTKGTRVASLDGDKRKKIPVHPYRVAENIDGSICVSDWVSDKEGRVVLFSHDGKVRMVYYGNKPDHRSFYPFGICCDKYGHILVGDVFSKEVHVLDMKGHFVRVLLTSDDLKGEKPYSLAIDSEGHLWIGNERKQIKVYEYYRTHRY